MQINRTLLAVAAAATLLLGACHSVPKHARFIPKDALAVIGVNVGGMSKELAWEKIKGSRIFDELEKKSKNPQAVKNGIQGLENAGIDFMNTMYLYMKPDTRFTGGERLTAIVPLRDKAAFETWLKKVSPGANIHTTGNRREALLSRNMYAGWDDEVVMVMNAVMQPQAQQPPIPAETTDSVTDKIMAPDTQESQLPDEAATAAEMDNAFKLPKDAAITGNPRFNELAREGHDVSYFVNNDAIMNSTAGLASGLMGMSMGATLWKGTAMTGGFDFEKGAVEGIMRYYSSDSLRPIAREFGRENIDDGMVSRLPGQNLNMAFGYHISPKAVKMILDKMGYSGYINLYLASQGFSVENILGAFTGDAVFSVSNFKMVKNAPAPGDTLMQNYGGMSEYAAMKPQMDYTFAMKIGNRADFDRLFNYLNTQAGLGLMQSSPNIYTLPAGTGLPFASQNFTLAIADKYFVIANSAANAQAFIKGSGSAAVAVKKEIAGHPAGFYADLQSLMQGSAAMVASPSDSMAMAEVRRVFADFGMRGGEFKDGANEYKFSLRMADKTENSLLQLLELAQRMSELQKTQPAI